MRNRMREFLLPRCVRRPLRPALLALIFAPLFLGGCLSGGADPYSKRYSSRDLNANPALLNGTIVKNSDLSGLRLENVVIRDATLLNTKATGAYLKNVVFDNCRLMHAVFESSVLENVTFKGGVITCERDADNLAARSRFTKSRFTNLTLDGTYLENVIFDGSNSAITIRNVHHIIASAPLVTGGNVALTLHNSLFKNMVIASVTGNSTLQATDCTFYYSGFGNSEFRKTTFRKNITYGPGFSEKKPRASRAR